MDFKISKVLAKDLLQKKSLYIKDEQLIFNRIVIDSHGVNDCTIHLYYDGCHLASITADCCLEPYMKFDFQLNDSNMKLRFEDEDLCDLPDPTPFEAIEDAAIEIMKKIKSLKRSIDSE